ncbi:hypothetical protein BCR37DRAFT_395284 [Protomyces lactucae-debilis]|uniref:ER membrane protein complex subunit 10 n=1 Tax=Protomyces lactucae-debilis TaxID=2754530 RepID=A0A1Y2EYM0_PROLT|nr:uncharacterized protein BCR37DRAFT_395284 [Protomyces lactucae-debilis]ORY76344.1 hypothetical protein BCR37DRAFT_395284 [Protomyces lactucae-debilis]
MTLPLIHSTSLNLPYVLEAHGQTTLDTATLQLQSESQDYSVNDALKSGAEVYRLGVEVGDKALLGIVRLEGLDAMQTYAEKLTLHLDSKGQVYHVSLHVLPVEKAQEASLHIQVVARLKPDPELGPHLKHVVKKAVEQAATTDSPEVAEDLKVEEVEEEVVPKSFLQKYWIYIIPFLLVLVLAPAQDDKEKEK